MKIVIDARGGVKEWWPIGRELLPIHFYKFEEGSLFKRTLNFVLKTSKEITVLVDERNKFFAIEEMEKLGIKDSENKVLFDEIDVKEALIVKPFIIFSESFDISTPDRKVAYFYKPLKPKVNALYFNEKEEEYVYVKDLEKAKELFENGWLVFSGMWYGNLGEDIQSLDVAKIKDIEIFTSFHDLSFFRSPANVKTYSTNDVVIFAENETIVKGVGDLIVVNLADITYIESVKEKSENEKLYKEVKKENSQKVSVHKTAYRPWGSYTVLEEKEGFKVKRITVKPGKRLSLQYHFRRSENWTVVKGVAKVRLGDKDLILKPGDHVYIPKKEIHRLENVGKELLEVIEVQVGDYLGEDDIVRIEDDFKRV